MTHEEFLNEMFKGHPDCKYPIESKVYKVWGEEGDHHEIASEGIVKGSTMVDGQEMYLIDFNDSGLMTFIVGEKISNESPIVE